MEIICGLTRQVIILRLKSVFNQNSPNNEIKEPFTWNIIYNWKQFS